MKKIKQICPVGECTGCSACSLVCPVSAISMQKNEEGFLYPNISDNCIACGRCIRVCPQNYDLRNAQSMDFYMAINSDSSILKASSSGGVFHALASLAISKSWKVCGAALDKDMRVKHIVVSDERDIAKLMGSKYLQSSTADAFNDICDILKEGGKVLFSGTPCQVAGLRSLIGAKRLNTDNLFCVDLICHSVPSPEVFASYLKATNCVNADEIRFRDKSTGWRNYSVIVKRGGEVLSKSKASENLFIRAFLSDILSRKSCGTCKYASLKRTGDLTIGDFWGIAKIAPHFPSKNGVSLLMPNTQKGLEILEQLGKGALRMEKSDKWSALKSNVALHTPSINLNRRQFFGEWEKNPDGVLHALEKYSRKRKGKVAKALDLLKCQFLPRNLYGEATDKSGNVAILNLSYGNFNFGAVLLAFAMQRIVLKAGFTPYILNYNPNFKNYWKLSFIRGLIAGLNFLKFKYSFLNTTRLYTSEKALRASNQDFDRYIFGSDQIWRYAIAKENFGVYFGRFVQDSKRLISYAASFGKDTWDEATEDKTKTISGLLKRFDAISVREDSGVRICREVFGVDAQEVLDPTLLLDASEYAPILNTARINTSFDYFAISALDKSELLDFAKEQIAKKFCTSGINILSKSVSIFGLKRRIYRPVEDWLKLLRDSKFVLTDSFHCCVFAILFRKQFICLSNENRGNSRLESLFAKLGLESRLVKDKNSMLRALSEGIDYDSVFLRLEKQRRQSTSFMESELSK